MNEIKIKAQIKVYLEGDEENSIQGWVKDIKVMQKASGIEVNVPNTSDLQGWIRRKATELLMRRLQATVDQEILESINIITENPTPDDTPQPAIEDAEIMIHNEPAEDIKEDVNENASPMNVDQPPQFLEPDIEIVEAFKENGERDKKTVSIVIRKAALDDAKSDARKDISRETGGVMLGTFLEAENTITVIFSGIVPALRAVRETSTVNFTEEAWAEIWRTIDQDKIYSDDETWRIVGWYHTHPGFGIFLSPPDQFIHKEYFTLRGHFALVIDPIQDELGYFMTDKAENQIAQIDDDTTIQILKEREFNAILKQYQLRKSRKKIPSIVRG